MDSERSACGGRGRPGGHQPDELRAHDFGLPELGFGRDALHDLVQGCGFPVLDVHGHLHQAGSRQVEPKCPDAGKSASLLADQRGDLPRSRRRAAKIHVERDQGPSRPSDHSAGRGVQPRRAEVGSDLPGVEAALELVGAAAPVEAGSAARRLVDEDGEPEVRCNALGDVPRGGSGSLEVVRLQRNDGNDVGCADPRMSALVAAQVDAFDRDRNSLEQRVLELVRSPDDREDGAVVILVRVHVENPGVRREGVTDRRDRDPVAALAEVGYGLEGQHGAYSRRVRDYYHRRAPEYDDWYLGRGRFDDRERPGWDTELAALAAVIESLPPARTLDVACGTGFLTRHLRGDVVGLDQSTAMLEEARRQAPTATYVAGDALSLPFPDGAFDRVFTGHFYGHLESQERGVFLAEARRVAGELVVVDASRAAVDVDEQQSARILNDGSRWTIYKRYFRADALVAELDGNAKHGSVLFDGHWFVAVSAPL